MENQELFNLPRLVERAMISKSLARDEQKNSLSPRRRQKSPVAQPLLSFKVFFFFVSVLC